MSDINVQPVNLLKISTFHNAKSPGTAAITVPGLKIFICKILHHTALRHCRNCRCRFRDVDDTALGGKEHAGY